MAVEPFDRLVCNANHETCISWLNKVLVSEIAVAQMIAAAKAGKSLPDESVLFAEVYSAKLDANHNPVTGADGFYVADQLLRYTAMEREAGWGDDIPELLRNENWNYAIFTTAKRYQQGVNQAECLACHKPLSDVSYTFTLKQLSTAK